MMSYGLKLGGAGVLILLAGVVAIIVFGNIWARIGIGAAMVVVFGALLIFAWAFDRKERAKRQGLEDLPPV
jgi:Flp pilus assembly protein TadB